jgi:hypothetical protein
MEASRPGKVREGGVTRRMGTDAQRFRAKPSTRPVGRAGSGNQRGKLVQCSEGNELAHHQLLTATANLPEVHRCTSES